MASWHYLCLVLEWAQVQKIMRGIASDLDHIHTRATPAIIHGDLKPDNILLGQPLKWLESWFRPYKKMLEGVLFDMSDGEVKSLWLVVASEPQLIVIVGRR
ncbi:receptor-like kinase LIP1 isoform X3 [Camellia sinensis]|uniref:receptor-like kinase LIP1 isoform X3 n=1 Tax=Camellia sinensis TaxID=4442 RepID=UPI001036AF29|nr:receptor-like kinase LIP1 isoform X3 [Camellia sinensis]